MNDSLSEWLALREAADWASRSERLVRCVNDALASKKIIRALDLCTGTGSNLRYLLDRLSGEQQWLVVDRDVTLLKEVPKRLSSWARVRNRSIRTDGCVTRIDGDGFSCAVATREMNLNRLDTALFEGLDLVTASALLDLVSESWLRLLAERCRDARAAALFTITYNGGSSCDPVEPEDEMVRELMNLHQRNDKGLGGPAAGPDAGRVAERAFADAGYCVESAPSDWVIEPAAAAFQRMLIQGWAQAATEMAPSQRGAIDNWLRRRLAHVEAGRSRIVVNHVDMVAWLGGQEVGLPC
jgi:hypothetical protein